MIVRHACYWLIAHSLSPQLCPALIREWFGTEIGQEGKLLRDMANNSCLYHDSNDELYNTLFSF